MHDALKTIWGAAGGTATDLPEMVLTGSGALSSVFAVNDLALASIGAASAAALEYRTSCSIADASADRRRRTVTLHRDRVTRWFASTIDPIGWKLPAAWDEIAGDYRCADGWIRLHTNAPHHRAAALGVLALVDQTAPTRTTVASAVSEWAGDELETAIVAAGGCAARMRSVADWQVHPQGRSVAAEPLMHRARTTRVDGIAPVPGTPGKPLRGVKVLDLTRVLAGPVASRWLAGLGAEVLRIDPPHWEEPAIVPEMTLGKRTARLDLTDPSGLDRLRQLLTGADVLLHGYRPGALDRLGFDDISRDDLRPGLIDVSLDAYGWTGPWAGRRGFDSLVQMSSGIAEAGMVAAGADVPRPLPVQALDHATGYLLATAALRGLTDRTRDGRGTRARVSLARTAALLIDMASPDSTGTPPTITDDDYAPTIEHTDWGPARRLRPPAQPGDTTLHWALPANRLGSHRPEWTAIP